MGGSDGEVVGNKEAAAEGEAVGGGLGELSGELMAEVRVPDDEEFFFTTPATTTATKTHKTTSRDPNKSLFLCRTNTLVPLTALSSSSSSSSSWGFADAPLVVPELMVSFFLSFYFYTYVLFNNKKYEIIARLRPLLYPPSAQQMLSCVSLLLMYVSPLIVNKKCCCSNTNSGSPCAGHGSDLG